MSGVQTLKRGHIWRVGDDGRINVWDDEWIPNSPTRKVITAHGDNLLSKVSDFIDPVMGRWDEELVSQTFWQVDVARILAISLPEFDMSDFVAWNLCKNGSFLVRSAYFAEWHNQYGHKISGENTVGPSRNSPIWGLSGVKVKKFLWRTLLGSLPCRVTLANRHIKVNEQCPRCGIGAEDTKHLLFTCAKAKEV